jgi:hypothetical protein
LNNLKYGLIHAGLTDELFWVSATRAGVLVVGVGFSTFLSAGAASESLPMYLLRKFVKPVTGTVAAAMVMVFVLATLFFIPIYFNSDYHPSRFRFLSVCGVINTTLDTKPYILALDLLLWPFDETRKYPAEGPSSSVGKGLQVQPTTVAHSMDFLLQTLPFRLWYRI